MYSWPKLTKYANTEKTRLNRDVVVKQYHKC